MAADLSDLTVFVAVARAGGFREAARASGGSASGYSEAVNRLEARLGARLLNRTTRRIAPTEAGPRACSSGSSRRSAQSRQAIDVVNASRLARGHLPLSVPVSVA
jgi:DNA-binding transcriptional LysR family regulator